MPSVYVYGTYAIRMQLAHNGFVRYSNAMYTCSVPCAQATGVDVGALLCVSRSLRVSLPLKHSSRSSLDIALKSSETNVASIFLLQNRMLSHCWHFPYYYFVWACGWNHEMHPSIAVNSNAWPVVYLRRMNERVNEWNNKKALYFYVSCFAFLIRFP